MLTFLFWNLRNNPIQDLVARLAQRHDVDVLILAECSISPVAMLPALNAKSGQWFLPYSNSERITVYTKFDPKFMVPVFEDDEGLRTSIRNIVLPGLPELLLVAVHLSSKLYKDDSSQDFDLPPLASMIRETEERVKHNRTMLVGDLNTNPFATEMVAATGLHSVLSRKVAEEGTRTIKQKPYPYFYNPMWGHFGHGNDGPPGTYYRRGSTVTYFWNIFDQVLIRPSLLPYFDDENLKILEGDGVVSFLSNKKSTPRADEVSDHLPIVFCLNL
jgi:hypothetical protein